MTFAALRARVIADAVTYATARVRDNAAAVAEGNQDVYGPASFEGLNRVTYTGFSDEQNADLSAAYDEAYRAVYESEIARVVASLRKQADLLEKTLPEAVVNA